MNKKIEIAPSILSADFRTLEREVKTAQDAGADRIHCDVMDGVFVPNITFGPFVIEAVKKCVSIPLDVHLMITEPSRYVKQFCDAGSDILMVHAEACSDLGDTLAAIKSAGVKPGVTVNPDKGIELFADKLGMVDQVLIMTVFAGFGGQKFIPDMMEKVRNVRALAKQRGLSIDIEVDGGINEKTASVCAEAGVNVFVAGSYIFGTPDYRERIDSLRDATRIR